MSGWLGVSWLVLAVAWLSLAKLPPLKPEVTNLGVQLVVSGPSARPHKQLTHSLKLNVSWLPPLTGRKPSFYSVMITSEGSNSSNTTNRKNSGSASARCSEGSVYYVGHDPDQTFVLLPEDRFGADEMALDLNVELGCSYMVQVYPNPRASISATSPSILFTVPECVQGQCNCDKALVNLPTPIVNVHSSNDGNHLIVWKFESTQKNSHNNRSSIKGYRLSVGVPHLTSSSGLVVYNKTQIFTGDLRNDSFTWYQDKWEKGTKIFVAAQDSFGCSGGEGSYTLKKLRHHSFYQNNTGAILISSSIAFCLMIIGFISFIRCLKRIHNYKLISLGEKSTRAVASVSGRPTIEALLKKRNILYVERDNIEGARPKDPADEHQEISYERLRPVRELGHGQFGKVYLADLSSATGSTALVAVKMALASSDSARAQLDSRKQLLAEIAMVKLAGAHPHLVGLVGCCTLESEPVCLVLEYMPGGDLLSYLHRLRDACNTSDPDSPGLESLAETSSTSLICLSPSTPTSREFFANDAKPEDMTRLETEGAISHSEMMRFALEIAKGMEHLEAKGIVHRDLAARNVLMDQNKVLKISDFGLSRDGGAYVPLVGSGSRRLPMRWMPPEAIRRRAFTSKSDVWSYGLVLWEIASLGDFPYPRLTDEQLLRHLLDDDGRPDLDDLDDRGPLPGLVRDAMQLCWATEPQRRPSFAQIVLWLDCSGSHFNNPAYSLVPSRSYDSSVP